MKNGSQATGASPGRLPPPHWQRTHHGRIQQGRRWAGRVHRSL